MATGEGVVGRHSLIDGLWLSSRSLRDFLAFGELGSQGVQLLLEGLDLSSLLLLDLLVPDIVLELVELLSLPL